MGIRLAISGELTIATVGKVVDAIVAADRQLIDADSVMLDLSSVSFVTPGSIVTLAAIIEPVSKSLPRLQLLVPTSSECLRYMASAGFLKTISAFAEIVGAADVQSIEPVYRETLLPLTRLAASAEIPALLQRLEAQLDDMLGSGDESWKGTKRPILSAIRELCENVFQHAGETPGWIAAQKYRNGKTGKAYVEIAIGDAGRGIRRSLATRFTELLNVTDSVALQRMIAEKLTRSTNAYRGTGYFVLQLATKQLDGSFHLRSGQGAIDRRRGGQVQHREESGQWPGTQLQIRLTCG